MAAASNVLIFILVWTFTAVCQDYDDVSVSCEDVTGSVGEEVTFSCSVSLKHSDCCITFYKFLYPEKYNDSEIRREVFLRDSCEQRKSFTHRFSSTTVMTEQFRFFVQTTCGNNRAKFSVDITESSKPEPEDPDDISVSCEDVTGTVGEEVTFSCSVSLKCSERCIRFYKFLYPEKYKDSAVCREEFPPDPCEQRDRFTCRFSSTTVMTGQFRFFVLTACGWKETKFSVNTREKSKSEPVTEDPGRGSKPIIDTGAVVGSSIAVIIIIIIITGMTIFCVKRLKRNNPSGFQMNYERSASADPAMMETVNFQSQTK